MTITLPVTIRDKAKSLDTLRVDGNVPAVVYGPKQEPLSIVLEKKEFDKVLKEAGESTIIELTGLDKAMEVLIKDVEFNPVKQQVIHVDFYALEKGKEITTHVPLEFIGVAPVETTHGGTVTHILQDVKVTCKPADLPSHIDVDVSVLVNIEDKIHVSDLKVAKGVVIHEDGESPVAVVSAARVSTEDEENAEVDMEAIEVEKKGKEEEVAE
ncbi:50S ribosomal protein L25 [Candidatus Nomurabacteria bacterium]|nr:50S ribosomal protein L25 [Candidatus Kaiserbacteria bacterium]MCB9814225.1 50S ribosomal protein L25 [Candidatus Nomurabacteria bacterium]